uniref:Uncharacterized protein n=1 Tax=Anguilla anguilla TaxID=7936 RepID=A0A0E9PIR5_ANGAN
MGIEAACYTPCMVLTFTLLLSSLLPWMSEL